VFPTNPTKHEEVSLYIIPSKSNLFSIILVLFLPQLLEKEESSYFMKLIINLINYYINDIYKDYKYILNDKCKNISNLKLKDRCINKYISKNKFILKKQMDDIKKYSKFVGYLPNCVSLDHFKKEINTYIISKISNKEKIIDISKLNFWRDIPKLIIKILAGSITSSIFAGQVKC
jgi:hypothetical protein